MGGFVCFFGGFFCTTLLLVVVFLPFFCTTWTFAGVLFGRSLWLGGGFVASDGTCFQTKEFSLFPPKVSVLFWGGGDLLSVYFFLHTPPALP